MPPSVRRTLCSSIFNRRYVSEGPLGVGSSLDCPKVGAQIFPPSTDKIGRFCCVSSAPRASTQERGRPPNAGVHLTTRASTQERGRPPNVGVHPGTRASITQERGRPPRTVASRPNPKGISGLQNPISKLSWAFMNRLENYNSKTFANQ